mgnify:FL=1
MKIKILFYCLFFLGLNLFAGGAFSMVEGKEIKHIALIGASVGYGWDVPRLPQRIKRNDYEFEYVGSDDFDKSEFLKKVLQREKKPDMVILKECAAYFPGEFEKYKRNMESWIEQSFAAGVTPIMTTVAPVTRPNYFTKSYLKDLIKKYFFTKKTHMEERLKYILEYNDWVREYAKEKGLIVLDMEAALRVSDKDRRLRQDLTSGDGLHLNSEAYKILDDLMSNTLKKI